MMSKFKPPRRTVTRSAWWQKRSVGLLFIFALGMVGGNVLLPANWHARWLNILLPKHSSSTYEDALTSLRFENLPKQVFVRTKGNKQRPIVHVVNRYWAPVEVEIQSIGQDNVSTSHHLPIRVVVPPLTEMPVLAFWASDPNKPMEFSDQYVAVLGDPRAVHKPKKPYRLPFANGKSFPISQAWKGSFSHTHPESLYAVDFVMPQGTPVLAARAGVVVEVIDHFRRADTSKQNFDTGANLIRILHNDGTMAVYAHLQYGSAQVIPGTTVREGQMIGRSGNTGFSTGPHLHFAVQRNRSLELVSIPFEFRDENGKGFIPEVRTIVTAYP